MQKTKKIYVTNMGAILAKLANHEQPSRILLLGLDGAGKTTMVNRLKMRKVSQSQTVPTIGFNVETLTPCKGLTFQVWDVGGQTTIRRLWSHYFKESDGLIFMVDSNDEDRLSEAHQELFGILESPDMTGVPVLILANKQDLPFAQPVDKLIGTLQLGSIAQPRGWHIQPCCVNTGVGLMEGLKEFSRMVKERKKSLT